MLSDLRVLHEHRLEASHNGRPNIVHYEHTGRPGRPRAVINPDFLRWAYPLRSTTGLAHFLGLNRDTVRQRLLELGIASPGNNPFPSNTNSTETEVDEILDAQVPEPLQLPDSVVVEAASIASSSSSSSYLSRVSDQELDSLLGQLRVHYSRAGYRMLDGMLRRLGHIVPVERIRHSLLRIDPVHRVFQRIRIRRRGYSVPGPNFLWHHDGHHREFCIPLHFSKSFIKIALGLIRWGIVIHGFIDGYSRMITGMRASNNNRGQTVLSLFISAAQRYGIPSRLRGDHGVENIWVAAFMEHAHGEGRGSYIWGRYGIFFYCILDIKQMLSLDQSTMFELSIYG